MATKSMTRAIYRAVKLSGDTATDVVTAKIHYPAIFSDSEAERNSGAIPADLSGGPMPIVIFAPGINLPLEAYAWLGRALAERGIVTVGFQLIGETMPGSIDLSPALDVAATFADAPRDGPCGRAFQPLLDLLATENEEGLLAGALDLSSIWFGGHSAGGTTALLSADPKWFSGLRGVFTYGAHTGLSTLLGYPENYVHPIADIPALLIGGTQDGCIANSAARYGDTPGDAAGRIVQTFDQAIMRTAHDSHMAILDGANHFTVADAFDPSTGRAFIDRPETGDGDALRGHIASMVSAFVRGEVDELAQLLKDSLVADGRSK